MAQMAYVKAATDAKLPIASRLVTERGMAPLEGEGVNVAFNWRVELFAAFKDVLETKKIYSRFFRAAPGSGAAAGRVRVLGDAVRVRVEPEACVAGGRGGAERERFKNRRFRTTGCGTAWVWCTSAMRVRRCGRKTRCARVRSGPAR